jgi:hypothetical protein
MFITTTTLKTFCAYNNSVATGGHKQTYMRMVATQAKQT